MFADFSLGKVVKILILASCLDHAPALLSHFANLVKDGDGLVVKDE